MNLLEMLPRAAYHDEAHVGDFQGAVGRQMDAAEAARDDLMKQARPATATWGMTIYERGVQGLDGYPKLRTTRGCPAGAQSAVGRERRQRS